MIKRCYVMSRSNAEMAKRRIYLLTDAEYTTKRVGQEVELCVEAESYEDMAIVEKEIADLV